ncbi:MAG: hypothetical protein ACFFE8_05550 [Candidatus Heimdallarchaeota archaeon]
MPLKQRKRLIYVFLCLFISFSIMMANTSADPKTDYTGIVVVFDEAHGQFFNRSLYGNALAALTDLGIRIVFNTQPINETSLEGTDLFISTNPTKEFSVAELFYVREFLLSGESALLLANPLNEENDSLTGRGDILNGILRRAQIESIIGFWTYSGDIGVIKRTDRVLNDFNNAGMATHLVIDVNSSSHELLGFDNFNVTTLITTSCSVASDGEILISASSEAYAETVLGPPHSYSTEITLFASEGEQIEEGQLIVGGSSLMFSDLYDPVLDSTWYSSADNSVFWKNLVKWLVQKEDILTSPTPQFTDEMFVYLSIIAAFGVVFTVGGSSLFLVGSGRKPDIVKSDELIPLITKKSPTATPDAQPTSEKQQQAKKSKRERRIKQIQKRPPRSRRKNK